MRVLGNRLRWVAGVVDQDLLGGDQDVNGVSISVNIEGAVRRELQQVEAGQVAGRVVEEHVLGAWVAGIDAGRVLRGMPAVHGGVELHAGIAALPGGFGNLLEQVSGFVGVHYAAIADRLRAEIGVADDGIHEVIGNAHGVVGVLEENGGVGVGVGMRAVVAHGDQGMRLGFLFGFAIDEVNDVGMVDV